MKSYIKAEKTVIKFGDIETQKKSHQHEGTILIKIVDIDNIVVSNKVPFGFKYFIGYKGAKQN